MRTRPRLYFCLESCGNDVSPSSFSRVEFNEDLVSLLRDGGQAKRVAMICVVGLVDNCPAIWIDSGFTGRLSAPGDLLHDALARGIISLLENNYHA